MKAPKVMMPAVSRRTLLVGGGTGAGLLLAWGLWPRRYGNNLNATEGEAILNGFVKIGRDGHVAVVVPQAEMGQGVTTALPMILADELGADWRTVSVEPAPVNPLYANDLLFTERAAELPDWLRDAGRWAYGQSAIRESQMITAGSSSIRAFEQRYREAGAVARALLCMAAGARLGADWQACDTENGFVVRGDDRIRFAELADEAAAFSPPSDIPLREIGAGKIYGQPVPRLDLPSKVDGSARFAGDVRLPGLVYASVRHGPYGDTLLEEVDTAKADAVSGVIGVVRNPRWVAAVATNWWAADRALDRMAPIFRTRGDFVDDARIKAVLDAGIEDADAPPGEGLLVSADYRVGLAAHAGIEPLTATARVTGDRLELWLPTQAPVHARRDAAAAIGFDEANVTVYPMLVGGGSGRALDTAAAEIAAILALKIGKPVQLVYARAEETIHDRFRPAAAARLQARLGAGGRIAGWAAQVAAPSGVAPWSKVAPDEVDPEAIAGARPPYAISEVEIAHAPVALGVPTGVWRSGAHSYTAFFTESFVDELARKAEAEPLGYRIQMLGAAPRLARCLATAAELGEWQGGVAGSGQGLACHSAFGSHIAMMIEAQLDEGRVRVDRVVAVADVGRMVHPDIVRQLIEGGIMWGLSSILAPPLEIRRGLPSVRDFDRLGVLGLAHTPEIVVELIETRDAPGGVEELAVPPVAPALANALFTVTGKRLRSLPLRVN